jgi:hypothetical protein
MQRQTQRNIRILLKQQVMEQEKVFAAGDGTADIASNRLLKE